VFHSRQAADNARYWQIRYLAAAAVLANLLELVDEYKAVPEDQLTDIRALSRTAMEVASIAAMALLDKAANLRWIPGNAGRWDWDEWGK
jgi:hypothetical protein